MHPLLLLADTSGDTSVNILSLNLTMPLEVVGFLVLLGILSKWVYPPIVTSAAQRQRQIDAARAEADAGRQEITDNGRKIDQTLEHARDEARTVISAAQRDAARDAEAARGKGRVEAQAAVEKAREELSAERRSATDSLQAQVVALVSAAATKLGGVDAEAAEKAAREVVR